MVNNVQRTSRDVNVLIFLKNDCFVINMTTTKNENETIVVKNDSF